LLKLRLAIISIFLCALLPALVLNLEEDDLGTVLLRFAPFSLAFVVAILSTLALPIRRYFNWLRISMLSVALYYIVTVGLHQLQVVPVPTFYFTSACALSLFAIVFLCCWVNSCISRFEKSVHQLALTDTLSSIQEPASEERVQSMLMHSRYTGQSMGLIALHVDSKTKNKIQSEFAETLIKRLANVHWQTEISSLLRKDLRLIDKFYKDESSDRLLLLCPGLNRKALAEIATKLEQSSEAFMDTALSCSFTSFPDEALTLNALLAQLDTKPRSEDTESQPSGKNQLEPDTSSTQVARSSCVASES